MIYLRLTAVGGVVALLLWAMHDRRWIEAIAFLFPMFSIASAIAIGGFEAQDRLVRTGSLLGCTLLAAMAPSLPLALARLVRDVSGLGPVWLFLAGMLYAFSLLAMLGWLFLPAAYAGVSLCRDWLKGRPRTDAFLFGMLALLFAWVWFSDVYGAFPGLHRLGWATLSFLYVSSGGLGALIGWLFYRLTGYPVSR